MVNTKIIAVALAWAVILTTTAVALNIYNKPLENQEIKIICNNNTGFKEAAECLHKDLMTFYNYNLTNRYLLMNETELRTKGGVCWQYAEWYSSHLKQLGYNAETYSMKGDVISHRIAIGWDNNMTIYCILDQTELKCVELG